MVRCINLGHFPSQNLRHRGKKSTWASCSDFFKVSLRFRDCLALWVRPTLASSNSEHMVSMVLFFLVISNNWDSDSSFWFFISDSCLFNSSPWVVWVFKSSLDWFNYLLRWVSFFLCVSPTSNKPLVITTHLIKYTPRFWVNFWAPIDFTFSTSSVAFRWSQGNFNPSKLLDQNINSKEDLD